MICRISKLYLEERVGRGLSFFTRPYVSPLHTKNNKKEDKTMLEELNFKELKLQSWRDATDKTAVLLVDSYNEIRTVLTNLNAGMKRDFVRVGFLLDLIKNTNAFTYACNDKSFCTYNAWDKTSFERFCLNYFGMGKSTVYGLIKVWRRFGTSDGNLRPEFESFTYSQLLEISYLPDDVSISELTPELTIKEIRALKPKKEKENSETTLSRVDYGKNLEVSKGEEKIISEEVVFPGVVEPFRQQIDLKTKKECFQKAMKNFFEKFNYVLYLNDRKQGGFAFGGVFFNYLKEHGFFDEQ